MPLTPTGTPASGPTASPVTMTYFGLANGFIDELHDSESGGMNHARGLETSLLLHLRPNLVRADDIKGDHLEEPYTHAYDTMFVGGPLSVHRLEEEYLELGAVGDSGERRDDIRPPRRRTGDAPPRSLRAEPIGYLSAELRGYSGSAKVRTRLGFSTVIVRIASSPTPAPRKMGSTFSRMCAYP